MKKLFLVAVVASLVLSANAMTLLNLESEVRQLELMSKRATIFDKVTGIQDILDKFVASVVNGTPLPAELVSMGADTDPQNFVMKVILMAASNLSRKRDLLTVAKVI
ncbi:hypothetical protein BsWGS_24072 [Bradybaena similaris]